MPKPTQTKVAEVAAPKDCTLVNRYDWDVNVAYAVCMAESRGDHTAHNYSDITKDDSYGLFQINLYGNLKHGRPSPEVLKDPVKNVEYAHKMYQSQGFKPWSTFGNGQYVKFLKGM